jgi:hypothetical protein
MKRMLFILAIIGMPILIMAQGISLGEPEIYSSSYYTTGIAIGDLNNDGYRDIILSHSPHGPGTFSLKLKHYVPGTGLSSIGELPYPEYTYGVTTLASVDLNQDSLDDVIVAIDTFIGIYYQRSNGMDSIAIIPTKEKLISFETGDFDNNGFVDIATGHVQSRHIYIFYQVALDSFITDTLNVPYATWAFLEAGDLNNDGKTDLGCIATRTKDTARLYSFMQGPQGLKHTYKIYQPPGDLGVHLNVNSFSVGDVTGDERDDLVISTGSDSSNAKVMVWRQKPNGSFFSQPLVFPTFHNPSALVLGDLDGDGLMEGVVGHEGWRAISVFYNGGSASEVTQARFSVPYVSAYHPKDIAIADLTGDGMPEVIVSHHNNKLLIFPNLEPPLQQALVDSSMLKEIFAQERVTREHEGIASIKAYPNPTDLRTDIQIDMHTSSQVELILFDLNGKQYFMQTYALQEGRNEVPIDLTEIPSGTYILFASDDMDNKLTHKLSIFH